MQRIHLFTNHWPPITNHCQPLPTIGRPLAFMGWQWFSFAFLRSFKEHYQKLLKGDGFHWLVIAFICWYYVFEGSPSNKPIKTNAYGAGPPLSFSRGGDGAGVEAIDIGLYWFIGWQPQKTRTAHEHHYQSMQTIEFLWFLVAPMKTIANQWKQMVGQCLAMVGNGRPTVGNDC